MTRDNVQAIRDGYAAFGRGDLDYIRGQFAPDIVWHVPGRSELAGDYRGIDAVLGYFVSLFEISNGTFKAELLECGEIAPELVAALSRISGTMPAGEVSAQFMQLFKREDDKTVEVWGFAEDQYAMDEAMTTSIALPDARKEEAPVIA